MATDSFLSYRNKLLDCRLLPAILLVSLVLNLWGIRWGAPQGWHPDEIIDGAFSMVASRTINPPHFFYGGLHYYVVAGGAIMPVYLYGLFFDPPPPKHDTVARARWWEPRIALMIPMARIISALMATLVVCFTFIIGYILYNKAVGYLAALLLSLSMSFVAVAHFATMDSPANFWYWLSCLFALLIWRRGDRVWYACAALAAGLAIGIKVDRAVVLFPLLVAHFLRGEGLNVHRLVTFAILVPGGYLLANPVFFTSTFQFLDGFTRDMFYQALKGRGSEQSSYLQVLREMKTGLGLPLYLAALSGLAYGFYSLASHRSRAPALFLLSTCVPYYLIFGFTSIQSWYLPILFPALMILAAHACVDLMSVLPRRYGFAAKAAVSALIVYSLIYTGALVSQFSNDSRYLAAEWIERNVPVNSTIEIGERGPVISADRYNVINSLRDKESMEYAREQHKNLERYRPYQEIRQFILNAEKWAGQQFGLPVRNQAYVNWIDNLSRNEKSSKDPQGIFPQAQYVVLIEDLYPETLRALTLPDSGYRLVAKSHFVDSFGLRPEFQFVNPSVYIFQRVASN